MFKFATATWYLRNSFTRNNILNHKQKWVEQKRLLLVATKKGIKIKIAVFWVVAPCSKVEVYQRFRGPCCDRPDDGGSKDL
jgi:hypothetical protein